MKMPHSAAPNTMEPPWLSALSAKKSSPPSASSRPLYTAAGMVNTGNTRPVMPNMRAPRSCGRSTQTQQAIRQPVTETAS